MEEPVGATTVAGALERAARDTPLSPFLHAGGETISYADMDEATDRLATAMLARGIRRGDRIALAAPNQPEWLYTYFAALKIGAVVVTLNVRYREREFDYMLNQSGARMLVCSTEYDGFDFAGFFAGFRARVPTVEDYVFLDGGGFPGSHAFADLMAATD